MAAMSASVAAVEPLPQVKQPRNPISRKQVEKVMSRSVAGFGIVFGAQMIPWLQGQIDGAYPVWLWIVVPALFGSLIIVLVMSIVQVAVRAAHGLFTLVYLGALVSWPFAVIPGVEVFAGIHWLNYLITVATAMAAIAFSTRIGIIYLVAAPTIYSIVRMTEQGGDASWELAVVEGVYAFILGAAIQIIVTMLRQASTKVDDAQATALDRYGLAVRQHAMEVERVEVDSIVHDSVLTTFISASRALTPQAQALAATMAANAIGHLKAAALVSPDDGAMLRFSALSGRIRDSIKEVSASIPVTVRSPGSASMPVQAADAVHSAAVQAMMNSLQHAGHDGVSRWVSVRGFAPNSIEVVVGDDGAGFVLDEISNERLGVRMSLFERVANAGGLTTIDTSPGEGTVITIRWPHRSTESADSYAEAGSR